MRRTFGKLKWKSSKDLEDLRNVESNTPTGADQESSSHFKDTSFTIANDSQVYYSVNIDPSKSREENTCGSRGLERRSAPRDTNSSTSESEEEVSPKYTRRRYRGGGLKRKRQLADSDVCFTIPEEGKENVRVVEGVKQVEFDIYDAVYGTTPEASSTETDDVRNRGKNIGVFRVDGGEHNAFANGKDLNDRNTRSEEALPPQDDQKSRVDETPITLTSQLSALDGGVGLKTDLKPKTLIGEDKQDSSQISASNHQTNGSKHKHPAENICFAQTEESDHHQDPEGAVNLENRSGDISKPHESGVARPLVYKAKVDMATLSALVKNGTFEIVDHNDGVYSMPKVASKSSARSRMHSKSVSKQLSQVRPENPAQNGEIHCMPEFESNLMDVKYKSSARSHALGRSVSKQSSKRRPEVIASKIAIRKSRRSLLRSSIPKPSPACAWRKSLTTLDSDCQGSFQKPPKRYVIREIVVISEEKLGSQAGASPLNIGNDVHQERVMMDEQEIKSHDFNFGSSLKNSYLFRPPSSTKGVDPIEIEGSILDKKIQQDFENSVKVNSGSRLSKKSTSIDDAENVCKRKSSSGPSKITRRKGSSTRLDGKKSSGMRYLTMPVLVEETVGKEENGQKLSHDSSVSRKLSNVVDRSKIAQSDVVNSAEVINVRTPDLRERNDMNSFTVDRGNSAEFLKTNIEIVGQKPIEFDIKTTSSDVSKTKRRIKKKRRSMKKSRPTIEEVFSFSDPVVGEVSGNDFPVDGGSYHDKVNKSYPNVSETMVYMGRIPDTTYNVFFSSEQKESDKGGTSGSRIVREDMITRSADDDGIPGPKAIMIFVNKKTELNRNPFDGDVMYVDDEDDIAKAKKGARRRSRLSRGEDDDDFEGTKKGSTRKSGPSRGDEDDDFEGTKKGSRRKSGPSRGDDDGDFAGSKTGSRTKTRSSNKSRTSGKSGLSKYDDDDDLSNRKGGKKGQRSGRSRSQDESGDRKRGSRGKNDGDGGKRRKNKGEPDNVSGVWSDWSNAQDMAGGSSRTNKDGVVVERSPSGLKTITKYPCGCKRITRVDPLNGTAKEEFTSAYCREGSNCEIATAQQDKRLIAYMDDGSGAAGRSGRGRSGSRGQTGSRGQSTATGRSGSRGRSLNYPLLDIVVEGVVDRRSIKPQPPAQQMRGTNLSGTLTIKTNRCNGVLNLYIDPRVRQYICNNIS